ncbi:MerR family transcriptional regulator [Myxococcaceae bacterium GXIMD 01537]
MTLRIRTIARLTGIREATLRAWERRHGFPSPSRGENNYRAYSTEEVEAIRRVARLIAEGLSVSEAIAQVRAAPAVGPSAASRFSECFQAAVARLDGDAAARALDAARAALDAREYADGFLQPLLRELGTRQDVAREHLASALIRHRLRTLLEAEEVPPGGPLALLACPERDLHEGGLLLLGLHLKRQGWRVTLLGADTPREALEAACAQLRPEVVALSFVRRREAEEFSAVLRGAVRACAPSLVVVGGQGAREHLRACFTAGAQYAESADELIALWQQVRDVRGRP